MKTAAPLVTYLTTKARNLAGPLVTAIKTGRYGKLDDATSGVS